MARSGFNKSTVTDHELPPDSVLMPPPDSSISVEISSPVRVCVPLRIVRASKRLSPDVAAVSAKMPPRKVACKVINGTRLSSLIKTVNPLGKTIFSTAGPAARRRLRAAFASDPLGFTEVTVRH